MASRHEWGAPVLGARCVCFGGRTGFCVGPKRPPRCSPEPNPISSCALRILIVRHPWKSSELVEHADAVVIGPDSGARRDASRWSRRSCIVPKQRCLMPTAFMHARANSPGCGNYPAIVPSCSRPTLVSSVPSSLRWPARSTPTRGERLRQLPWNRGPPSSSRACRPSWPEGQASRTVAAGNPGLATGGSGDILAGICGAFLAGGIVPEQAAALAAQALGRAGDLAARRHTARAMRPMDVIAALPDLWRTWALLRTNPPRANPPVLLDLPRPRS